MSISGVKLHARTVSHYRGVLVEGLHSMYGKREWREGEGEEGDI